MQFEQEKSNALSERLEEQIRTLQTQIRQTVEDKKNQHSQFGVLEDKLAKANEVIAKEIGAHEQA
jgi:hypothetical protein